MYESFQSVIMFSIKGCVDSLDSSTLEQFNINLALLEAEAKKRKFQLRDDSKLMWIYCINQAGIQWTPTTVIDELVGIDVLYKHTNYKSNCEEGLRIIANEMKRRYDIKWEMVWHFVREFGTAAIKYETLRRNNLSFGQLPST